MDVKVGDIIIGALPGAYGGKPRPYIVIQSKHGKDATSILICPTTTYLTADPVARMLLTPTELNNLSLDSEAMLDKIGAIKKDKIQKKIGELSPDQLKDLIKAIKSLIG